MKLSRQEFNILDNLACGGTEKPQENTDSVFQDLIRAGFIENGRITQAGLDALEPYRVKRAIFIAAGFGTRMLPITVNTPKPLVRVFGIRIIDRLIDACLAAGITEIIVVRGHLAEQFDQLLYKYPMIKFFENPYYKEANYISSTMVVRDLLSNAYVFEADLLLYNPKIIRKYHYSSNFLGIKMRHSDDWCFRVKDGIIVDQKIGGDGDDNWQMVGISWWSEEDGRKLEQDIADVFTSPGGMQYCWEQVPLVLRKEHYSVEIRDCFAEDIVEIDSFSELKQIDNIYEV